MNDLERMNYRRGIEAIEALSKLDDARSKLKMALGDFTRVCNGPQGISSNIAFIDAVMRLADSHLAHRVVQHKNALIEAIWKDGGP